MFSCVNHFHILSNPDASPYFLNILLVPPIPFRQYHLVTLRIFCPWTSPGRPTYEPNRAVDSPVDGPVWYDMIFQVRKSFNPGRVDYLNVNPKHISTGSKLPVR